MSRYSERMGNEASIPIEAAVGLLVCGGGQHTPTDFAYVETQGKPQHLAAYHNTEIIQEYEAKHGMRHWECDRPVISSILCTYQLFSQAVSGRCSPTSLAFDDAMELGEYSQ